MAKEEAEGRLKVEVERDAAVKALEEEKADRKAFEERIKEEAYELARADSTQEIVNYGMSFKCSALFMIREGYLNLNLLDIDLTEMRGWDKPDLTDGFNR